MGDKHILIDAHCHINIYNRKGFGKTLLPAIEEIESNKILTISNSMDLTSYRLNKKISRMCEHVIPAFGIHPWNAHKYTNKTDIIKNLIRQNQIIGEIGLDHFFVKDADRYPAQQKIFELFLAQSRDRILSIHSRGADKEVLNLLKKYGNKRVVIHWYAGPPDVLEEMIKQGYYFSIGPKIDYSEQIREIACAIPLSQILTETDNPGGPASFMSELAMPVLIKKVIKQIAKCKNETADNIEKQVERNFVKLSEGIIPESVFANFRD